MEILAVVPIFTSAGAALLPTILAAIASVAAIVLKPRELWRLGRRRPVAVAVSAAVIVIVFGAVILLSAFGTTSRAMAHRRPESNRCDRLGKSRGRHYRQGASGDDPDFAFSAVFGRSAAARRVATDAIPHITRSASRNAARSWPRLCPLFLRRRTFAASIPAALELPSGGARCSSRVRW